MPKPKLPIDGEPVKFLAVPGSKDLYKEVAALEGARVDVWIRTILHAAAIKVLEAHGRDTSDVPAINIKRPPRLQPRYSDDDGGSP